MIIKKEKIYQTIKLAVTSAHDPNINYIGLDTEEFIEAGIVTLLEAHGIEVEK